LESVEDDQADNEISRSSSPGEPRNYFLRPEKAEVLADILETHFSP
jgi:hypothetical protein